MATSGGAYRDGVLMAYRGELVGEHLYRGLAALEVDAKRRAKLLAIADIEGLTHRRLRPIAQRLGIEVTEADWGPVVRRRTHELGSLSWREFIDKAVIDWPPYIGRFAALLPVAPRGDAICMQRLVDHEVALVAFARCEEALLRSADAPSTAAPVGAPAFDASLRLLQDFLAADDARGPAPGC